MVDAVPAFCDATRTAWGSRSVLELDTDADAEQLAVLLRLTERYCVVLQTLRAGPEMTVRTVT